MRNHPSILRLREWLANFYLDFAEKLPTFHGTVIATLQEMRRGQREEAEAEQQRVKPPEGSEITYSWLRLVELFPIEDYDRMERGLRALLSEVTFGRDLLADFKKTAMGLSSLANSLVGHLSPKAKPLIPFPHGVLAELPPEVEGITIRLHKILPSAFALSMDVRLGPTVTDRLRQLQARTCLPAVRFRQWIPWGRSAFSHTRTMAEATHRESVIEWLVELRGRIEKVLSPYINGYFTTVCRGGSSHFPAIEMFTLSGVPQDGGGFEEWLTSATGWLGTIGATRVTVDWYGFKGKDLLFLLPADIDAHVSAYRGFLIEGSPNKKDANEHRQIRLQEMLDAAIPLLVFNEFLAETRGTIAQLRKKVYERLSSRSRYHRLRRDFELNQQLQRESMLLSRFEVEMEQSEDFIKRYVKTLDDYHRCGGGAQAATQRLSDVLVAQVKWQAQTIKKHLDLASRLFSDHLSWRNLDANYRLQRQIKALTWIVVLATVVGVILPKWEVLKRFYQLFLSKHW